MGIVQEGHMRLQDGVITMWDGASWKDMRGFLVGPWVGVTFLNSWVNTAAGHPVQYRLEGRDGIDGVRVYGSCQGGTIPAPIFNLPYHPAYTDNYFPVVSNGAFGTVLIDGGGDVYAWSGSNASFRLNLWLRLG